MPEERNLSIVPKADSRTVSIGPMLPDKEFIAGTSVSSWVNTESNEEIKVEEVQGSRKHMFSTADQSFVNLTIKNYNLVDGLSSRFFDEDNEYFGITGPLGKGLGITP